MKVVMLAGEAQSTKYFYHGISKEIPIDLVIQETPVSIKKILKGRAKRLGYFNVLGQIIFGILVLPILRRFSENQKLYVLDKLKLNTNIIPPENIFKVPSVNSKACIKKLKELNPDVVIVNGCRIISKKTLNSIEGKFLNTHEGITPKYRGIHGAYWAKYNKDEANCGVTVHLVDTGVDTGGIIYQGTVKTETKDNFTTYPMYQSACGIPLMIKALKDIKNNDLKTIERKDLENSIWYHPTIWQYLYGRIFKGVK